MKADISTLHKQDILILRRQRGDSGVDHAAGEKGVAQDREKLARVRMDGRPGEVDRNCFEQNPSENCRRLGA